MRQFILIVGLITLVGGCGTVRGIVSGTGSLVNGAGAVLEGMSRDARSIGGARQQAMNLPGSRAEPSPAVQQGFVSP